MPHTISTAGDVSNYLKKKAEHERNLVRIAEMADGIKAMEKKAKKLYQSHRAAVRQLPFDTSHVWWSDGEFARQATMVEGFIRLNYKPVKAEQDVKATSELPF